MENKYYTPNIEDLFVGYECETEDCGEYAAEICATPEQYKEMWFNDNNHPNTYKLIIQSKDILDYSNFLNTNIPYPLGRIRTKYLTKEDIEKEGWSYTTILVEDDHFVDGYAKNIILNDGLDRWYTLEEFSNNRIKIVYSVSRTWKTLFEGECKSLNEFRKICKSLSI